MGTSLVPISENNRSCDHNIKEASKPWEWLAGLGFLVAISPRWQEQYIPDQNVRYCSVRHLAVMDVKTGGEMSIVSQCLLPSFIG